MGPTRRDAVRHGVVIAAGAVLAFLVFQAWLHNDVAGDARAYWEAFRAPDPYGRSVVAIDGSYLYSPAFLQVLWPLFALPWELFLAAWYVLGVAAILSLARTWLPLVLISGFVVEDLVHGNVEPLMAVAIVAGFRYPAAWAFILLTKVTPGIGLVWFVARREWRNLAIALGTTVVVAESSFLLAPGLWREWIASLGSNSGQGPIWPLFPIPLSIRFAGAAIVVWLGARRDWRWVVPVGATLAMPLLWPVNLTLLLAVIPFLRRAAGHFEGRTRLSAPAPSPASG